MCGKLVKAMYGTRDAAQNWEYEYSEFMDTIGFKRGKASPNIFYHEARNIRAVIHGDDFTILGNEYDLDWFRREISQRYEVKFRGRIGPSDKDDKAIRILSRVVTWTEEGIEYEADQRHAEIIIKEARLTAEAKTVISPGIRPSEAKEEEDDEDEVEATEASRYRAVVARANYIAQDRTDIAYATKELSRGMSRPTRGNQRALKRLARYLIGKERAVNKYKYQQAYKHIEAWVDTDYAGCRKTRKSTSGGIIRLGNHVIKTWSTTQSVIALSSGEAEYYGMVKGGSVGLGIQSMMQDMGAVKDVKIGIKIHTDASAAKGIATRKGLGKVRHIEVNQLWLQDKVSQGDIEVVKVPGDKNIADILTKHVEGDKVKRHCSDIGMEFRQGRHKLMPTVARDEAAS